MVLLKQVCSKVILSSEPDGYWEDHVSVIWAHIYTHTKTVHISSQHRQEEAVRTSDTRTAHGGGAVGPPGHLQEPV